MKTARSLFMRIHAQPPLDVRGASSLPAGYIADTTGPWRIYLVLASGSIGGLPLASSTALMAAALGRYLPNGWMR